MDTVVVLQILLLCLHTSNGNLFTSMVGLEKLVESERQLIENLRKFIDKEERNLQELERLRKTKEISEYGIANPIAVFKLITTTLKSQSLLESVISGLRNNDGIFLPNENDLRGAAIAISRLQYTYNIPHEQLAENLTGDDTFYLGFESLKSRDSHQAVHWLRLAEKKYAYKDTSSYVHIESVYCNLAVAFLEQNLLQWALYYAEKAIAAKSLPSDDNILADANCDADLYKLIERIKSSDPLVFIDFPTEEIKTVRPSEFAYLDYEKLCRGETFPFKKAKRWDKLVCFLKTVGAPFLRYAPFKVERVSFDPMELFLFKDVISDKEIEVLMDIATPKLDRAKVINEDQAVSSDDAPGRNVEADFRIAKNMWIEDSQHAAVARISRRVADFTGLTVDYAEHLQMANYGLGGHYEPHFDMSMAPNATHGNRIATVLFYLSDVEAGGATVFQDLNLAVFPSKNDAAFWFNIRPSGFPEIFSLHGGCPVLRGVKWVANKWLHEFGQEFTRPCGLSEKDN